MNNKKMSVFNNKKLIEEWDYSRNEKIGLNPTKITIGSNKLAFWICKKCGSSFSSSIKNRNRTKIGCPICAKKSISISNRLTKIKDKVRLSESHPDLCKEWVECLTENLTPQDVTANSNQSVKWKCSKCGEIFVATIPNRTSKHSGCPYCAGIKVRKGVNDLQTINPLLAEEWSDKNELSPSDYLPFSSQKVYWKCPVGHEDYIVSIKKRNYGQGCPICARESQTSFPEQAIYYYIKQICPDAINRYKYDNKLEIDIFIPNLKIGIEYNGYFAHKNREEKYKVKKEILVSKGINLIVVKEFKNSNDKYGADFYISNSYDYQELDLLIKNLLIKLNIDIEVNTSKDFIRIKEQYLSIRKQNSIVAMAPHLIEEWDTEKNGNINPEYISVGSNQKYYWKCPKCHSSYLAQVKSRVSGTGCPICSGKVMLNGENDLATRYPELANSWDYDLNKCNPCEVYGGGKKKYYWKCDKGHSYRCSIENRIKGRNCPYCAGKKVLNGFNDFLTIRPNDAADWDKELNEITPSQIHFNNQTIKVHWKCHVCNYKWISTVSKKGQCVECQKKHKQINVYNLDGTYYGSFSDIADLCNHFDINYKKQHGNISSVCNRKQKTLLGKYILRHADDDEFFKEQN